MRSAIFVVALFLFGAVLGWAFRGDSPGTVVTVVDTVPPAEMFDRLAALEIERDGLRARLEGVRDVAPRIIVRTDTLVQPPDTVFTIVTVRDGSLDFGSLIRVDTLFAPELQQGFDVSRCDEGFSVSTSGVICDPARLGHLYVFTGLSAAYGNDVGTTAELGIWWQPSYRSSWRTSSTIDSRGALSFNVRKGFQIF